MRYAIPQRLALFLHECFLSPVGWTLVLLHAVWFYFGIRSMGPPSRAAAAFLGSIQGADWTLFAGRAFHFHYQSWMLKSLILADMPSMLIGGLLLWPVSVFTRVDAYEASYVTAGSLFLIASFQWSFVGRFLQKRYWR